jgi:hypothetical protein
MLGKLKTYIQSVKWNRGALIESGKLVFSLVGFSTVLADFSTMRFWFIIPALALFVSVWFALYSQMEGVQ